MSVPTLFESGIRPAIDEYLAGEQAKVRDYGEYWSASSAGYCMRKLMFERLGVPAVESQSDARKTRVFEAGHIFHEWVQRITKNANLSIVQELELQDDKLMIRGHIDDLVVVNERLILYDYKTQNSRAFTYQKGRTSYFHTMQAGTYLYMIRQLQAEEVKPSELSHIPLLSEARILKISKDDLRMTEDQILYTPELEAQVLGFWNTLNNYWSKKELPKCSCADKEGGFMAKEAYNPYFYEGEPCSIKLLNKWKQSNKEKNDDKELERSDA
jgi:hypothetical protein